MYKGFSMYEQRVSVPLRHGGKLGSVYKSNLKKKKKSDEKSFFCSLYSSCSRHVIFFGRLNHSWFSVWD